MQQKRNKTAIAIQNVALQLLQNRNFNLTPTTAKQNRGYYLAMRTQYSILAQWLRNNPNPRIVGQIQGYTVLSYGGVMVGSVQYYAIRLYSNGNGSRILNATTIPALKAVIATNMAINASMRSTNMAKWQYTPANGGYTPATPIAATATPAIVQNMATPLPNPSSVKTPALYATYPYPYPTPLGWGSV